MAQTDGTGPARRLTAAQLAGFFSRYGWEYEQPPETEDVWQTGFTEDRAAFDIFVQLTEEWVIFTDLSLYAAARRGGPRPRGRAPGDAELRANPGQGGPGRGGRHLSRRRTAHRRLHLCPLPHGSRPVVRSRYHPSYGGGVTRQRRLGNAEYRAHNYASRITFYAPRLIGLTG